MSVVVCTLCTHQCAHIDRFEPSAEAGSLVSIFPLFLRDRGQLWPAGHSVNRGRLGTPESDQNSRYVFLSIPDEKVPFSQIGKKTPPFARLYLPESESWKRRLNQAYFLQEK